MSFKKIIVALDSDDLNKTIKLVRSLKKEVYAFKIGYQFFFNFGLTGYKKIYSICPKIFLDLKLHDIPNTVEKGLKALIKIKPVFTTIHISGGDEMMKSTKIKGKETKILGDSILTSLDSKQTKNSVNFIVNKIDFFVILNQKKDFKSEIKSLEKEFDYYKNFHSKIIKKLSNKSFASKAPKKVIEIEKKREIDISDKIKILELNLKKLSK